MSASRLTRVKNKRATKQATLYIVLAVIIGFVMIAWGIPEIARLSGLLIQTDNGDQSLDELRPTPPIFSDIPESANQDKVDIAGFAQPGVEVLLYVNGTLHKKILTDEAGIFRFGAVPLTDGDNRVYAYALTSRGTESEQSREYSIVVDKSAPEVTLISPTDGQVYRGERERIAEIKGSVGEEGVKVYVGDRMAIVNPDGTFSLSYQLIEGEQEIVIKAIDKAENEAELILRLRWEP